MDVGCVASDALTQDGFELHFSFLSAPPPAGDLGRPRSFRTRPVAPLGRARAQPELLAHPGLDLRRDLGMLAQEIASVLAALADAVATEGVPGTGLLDDALLGRDVDQLSLLGDAAAVQDVELRLAERRRHLVLHHLHLGAAADHLVAVLEGAEAADVEPDRGVELERVAARRGLRVAEQDADLHADLVDEDDDGPRLGDGAGQLAERLRHEPRLEAHLRIAHVALDLGARDQGSDRIDDQHVERPRAHQGVGDLERLLAVVGLRDEQVLGLDAELARVAHVEGVLRIDEGADAAALLALGDQLERERGLARRLGPVDLDHTPARDAADAEGNVEAERAGRKAGDVLRQRLLAELHDGALAELLLDLADGEVDRPLPIHVDAHVTPSPARSTWTPGPNFPETDLLYPGARQVSSRADYIFSGTGAPQGVPGHRRVHGPRRLEPALVEDDLRGRPGAERRGGRGLDRRGERAPGAWRAHAADGQVTPEGAPLGREAEGRQRPVDGRCEPRELGDACRDAGPQDAGAPEAREAPEADGGERDGRGVGDRPLQRGRHGRHAIVGDRAQELERQVELRRVHPADVGVPGRGADARLGPGDRRADVRGQVDGDEAAHGGAARDCWRIGRGRVIAWRWSARRDRGRPAGGRGDGWQIEQREAQKRVVQAEGIGKAMAIINERLSAQYLQHEAIEAQKAMVGSPNHTTVYLPVGPMGVPLVGTLEHGK